MDDRQTMTAADLVNGEPAEELAKIFWEYGGERDSRRFAKAIVHDRELRRFTTTRQLAELIERISPRHGRKAHPATKVFQALRIEVNDELGALKEMLQQTPKLLKPGGRVVIITFHSLEDRLVKNFFRRGTFDEPEKNPFINEQKVNELIVISKKPILPSEKEIKQNPRARSARLRIAEKVMMI